MGKQPEFYLEYQVNGTWDRLRDHTGSNLVLTGIEEQQGARLVFEALYDYPTRFTAVNWRKGQKDG